MKISLFFLISLIIISIISCGYDNIEENNHSIDNYTDYSFESELEDFDQNFQKDFTLINKELLFDVFKCHDFDENYAYPETKSVITLSEHHLLWKTKGAKIDDLIKQTEIIHQLYHRSYIVSIETLLNFISWPIVKKDKCLDNLWLSEQVCDRDEPKSADIYCPAISPNMVCEEFNGKGACVDKPCLLNGIGADYQFDTDGDNIKDSCLPCKTNGAEFDYKYDLDGDNIPESCMPCKINGNASDFIYDLDFDGTLDSCLPCIENGILFDFKYDLNGDGKNDACELPCEVKGKKAGYQFDLDGDGKNDSCFPPNLCKGFDPVTFKDKDAKLNDYNGSWYVSKCVEEGGSTLQTFFCNKDGSMNKDIVECDPLACSKGVCKTCYDSDGFENFSEKIGIVVGKSMDENYFFQKDKCSDFYVDAMIDYDCTDTQKYDWSIKFCEKDEVCESNLKDGTIKCVNQYTEATCKDGDYLPQNVPNFTIKSQVSGEDKKKNPYIKNDGCSYSKEFINDFICKDIKIGDKIVGKEYDQKIEWCPADTQCKESKSGKDTILKCEQVTSGNNSKAVCTDSDENKDGTPNFKIKGFVTGIDSNGKPFLNKDYFWDSTIYDYVCQNGLSILKETKCKEKQIVKEFKENNDDTFVCVSLCEDEDELNDPQIFGKVINYDTKEVALDTCNGDILLQYKCDPATQKITEVDTKGFDCKGNGYSKCVKGACVK